MSRQTKGRRRLCVTRRQWRDRARTAEQGWRDAVVRIALLEDKVARRDEADKARLARKKVDAIDVGSLQLELKAAGEASEKLTAAYLTVKAELQEATSMTLPPMERDTTEPDPVAPIYERTLLDLEHARKLRADSETTREMSVMTLPEALGSAR